MSKRIWGFQTTTEYKHPYFSAMAAILRDRINDLLTANADLEREVAKLRYADAGFFYLGDFFETNVIWTHIRYALIRYTDAGEIF